MKDKKTADLTQNTQDRQRQNEILNEQLELISKISKSCYVEQLPALTHAMIEVCQLLRSND